MAPEEPGAGPNTSAELGRRGCGAPGDFGLVERPGLLRLGADFGRMLPSNLGFWLRRALGGAPRGEPRGEPRRVPFGAFVGINLAAGPDERHDDFVLDALEELGVRRARVDLGDTPLVGHALRLAGKLAARGVRPVAHLVRNPKRAAESSPGALASWRDFCRRVADEHGASLSALEAGSTPNRHKWSGHTLDGYLAAAGAAFEAGRVCGLEVWAPNVNDFEPYLSVGLLAALARRGLVPDRHTDNLFVDCAGVPEAGDGHTWPFRPDAAAKARVLAAIGRRYGCSGTVSTYASWTLDTWRLGRNRYVDEETYARLLVRYLALLAASGALDGAYWGQMIGHGKGLIDDGTRYRPRPPAAHHNFLLLGEPAGYRRRPAFLALAAMTRRLAPCTPDALERRDGALLCRFRGGEREGEADWLLAWTAEGSAPAPAELLEEALDVEDLCGRPIGRDEARTLSPSPLYFRLRASGGGA